MLGRVLRATFALRLAAGSRWWLDPTKEGNERLGKRPWRGPFEIAGCPALTEFLQADPVISNHEGLGGWGSGSYVMSACVALSPASSKGVDPPAGNCSRRTEKCDVVLCEDALETTIGAAVRGWYLDNAGVDAPERAVPASCGPPPRGRRLDPALRREAALALTSEEEEKLPPCPETCVSTAGEMWAATCEAAGIGCDRRDTSTALAEVSTRFPVTRYWRGLKRLRADGSVTPKDPNYDGPRSPVPAFLGNFDWVLLARPVWGWGKGVDDPTFVFCQPEALRYLPKKLRELPRDSGRLLYVGGSDARLSGRTKLSGNAVTRKALEAAMPWFERVFFEALDVPMAGVNVAPIGLNELYLQELDLNPLLAAADDPNPTKTRDVLATWGAIWDGAPREKIASRAAARRFCERRGHEDWLNCDAVKRSRWWKELPKYRFMLNPTGHGIQSPKWYEALLAGTIPICPKEPAFEALRSLGWPMVLVRDWDEVTSAEARQAWWDRLSPRLAALRAAGALTSDGYFRYLQRSLDRKPGRWPAVKKPPSSRPETTP